MKLPDELDTGGKWELVFHCLQIAEEDLASEIFPRTMGRRIVQAEEIRHSSDYDPFYIAYKGGLQKQIETAKGLLDYAKRFIVERREAEEL